MRNVYRYMRIADKLAARERRKLTKTLVESKQMIDAYTALAVGAYDSYVGYCERVKKETLIQRDAKQQLTMLNVGVFFMKVLQFSISPAIRASQIVERMLL